MSARTRGRWQAPLALLLLALLLRAPAGAQAIAPLSSFPSDVLWVLRGPVQHRFDVWIADTPQRKQQGLMHQRELAADRGMLFPYEGPRLIQMWMRNTLIELDMLFIDDHGRIVSIAARTPPLSDDIISSGVEAIAVLELRGGEAARRGIVVGDRVRTASLALR